jgi:hypothetical protein
VLPTLRHLMTSPSSSPEALILSPPARSYEQIGAQRQAVILEVQPYRRLAILAKEGLNTAVVSSLQGWSLDGVRAIVALSPSADHFSRDDLVTLGQYLARGGKVVTSPGVGEVLDPSPAGAIGDGLVYDGLVERRGNLYLAQQGIAVLFEDRRHETLSGFWQEALDLDAPQPGYRILTGRYAFHYHIGPEPATVDWALPFLTLGHRYDAQALPNGSIFGPKLSTTLGRREFVLLQRIFAFWPWI